MNRSLFTLHPTLAADTIEIGTLTVNKILLMNDVQFPWLILVPQRADITELYQLNDGDLAQVNQESLITSRLLMNHYHGDKLNIAAIGNMVPQLHLHHIVRFKNDAVWPKPVWGNINSVSYTETQLKETISALQTLYQESSLDFTAS